MRRDLEIDAFVPETYFQVDASFQLDPERGYRGRWFAGKDDRTPDRERAEAVAAAASGADASVLTVKRTERKQRPPLLYDLTSLQREANSRFGMSAQRTLAAAQRLYEGSSNGAVITYPRTRSQFLPSDQVPALKPIARSLAGHRRLPAARRVRGRAGRAAAGARGQQRQGRRPPRHHPHRRSAPRRAVQRRPPRLRPGLPPLPGGVPPRRPLRGHRRGHRGRRRALPHQGQASARGRLAGARLRRRADRQRARRRRGARAGAAAHRRGRARPLHRRRGAREADQAARPLHRGVAAGRDGDGRQVDRRRGAARGHEGERPGHARHPRRHHRAAAERGLHRARRQGAGGDQQGPRHHRAAGHARAHVGRADRLMGEAAVRDRARHRRADHVHGRHHQLHRADRRLLPRHPHRVAGRLPERRRRHRRKPRGLRLYLLCQQEGARLRLHHLEDAERLHGRSRPGAHAARVGRGGAAGARRGAAGAGRGQPARDRRWLRAADRGHACAGPMPQRRRRHPREPGRLRLQLLQEQEGAGLRLHGLEDAGQLRGHGRQRAGAAGAGRGAARGPEAGAAGAGRRQPAADRRRRRQAADRRARPLPERGRRDQGEPPRLRLLVMEEQGRARLRLHHLEVAEGIHDHRGRGASPARAGRGDAHRRPAAGTAGDGRGQHPPDRGRRRRPAGAHGGRQGGARDDRHLPPLWRRHPRQQPRLRLLVLEEPQEPGLRVRDLEVDEGPRDHTRAGQAGDRAGQHRAARVPRPPGRLHRPAGADRRQVGRGAAAGRGLGLGRG